MYYGLDALMHGAVAMLIGFLPAVALFWVLTRGLGGPRVQRPFVAVCAAFGIAQGGASLWAMHFERQGYADEAVGGALMIGAAGALVGFLILLMLPRAS